MPDTTCGGLDHVGDCALGKPLGDRVRKRWLRNAAMTSSAGKMLDFGERHKIADMTHIHRVKPPKVQRGDWTAMDTGDLAVDADGAGWDISEGTTAMT